MRREKPLPLYLKRFAKLGFLFFLIKGLLWLIVSIVIGALLYDK
jgi:hypothetical protein